MKLRSLLFHAAGAAFLLTAGLAGAQDFSGVGPAPASAAPPPQAPLLGCMYMPSGISITTYGRYGCTIGSNGGVNVNVLTGGGGGGSGPTQTFSDGSDGQATTSSNQQSVVRNYGYNGTAWDRARVGAGGAWLTIVNKIQQAGADLSPTNGLPTTDTNASQTIAAPGSDAGKAQAVQGVTGAKPIGISEADGANATLGSKSDTASAAPGNSLIAVERQLHADLIAPTPAGTAVIGKVGIDKTTPGTTDSVVGQGQYNSTLPTLTNGAYGNLQFDASNRLIVILGSQGTVPIGQVALNAAANAGGVSSFFRLPNATTTVVPATTNATNIKNGLGRLFKIKGCNYSTSDLTFHFTNTATAPTPGTTAVFDTVTTAASATAGKCNPFTADFADYGASYSAGISFWVSTGQQDGNATAPAATDAYSISVGYN